MPAVWCWTYSVPLGFYVNFLLEQWKQLLAVAENDTDEVGVKLRCTELRGAAESGDHSLRVCHYERPLSHHSHLSICLYGEKK